MDILLNYLNLLCQNSSNFAPDLSSLTNSTNGVGSLGSFGQSVAMVIGEVTLSGTLVVGLYFLVTGIYELSKRNSREEKSNTIIKIFIGACLSIAPMIIAIIVYSMTNASTNTGSSGTSF